MRIVVLTLLLAGVGVAQEADTDPDTPRALGVSRRVTLVDGRTININLSVSTPAEHVVTAVTFPAAVKEIITSAWKASELSVEHSESNEKLFLKLLSKIAGHLDVILADGRHVRLYLVPARGKDLFDAHVTIVPGFENEAHRRPRRGARSSSGALELIRNMRMGRIPPGVTVRKGESTVVFESIDMTGRLAYLYETAFFRGYIVRLENQSQSIGYEVDLPRFKGDNLLIVGARNLVVEPQHFTLVYFVFWKD